MRAMRIVFLLAILWGALATLPQSSAGEIKSWNLLTTAGPRGRVTAAVFKGAIYAVPAWNYRAYTDYTADGFNIWKSADGVHWTQSTPPWSRSVGELRLIVYRDMLWAVRSPILELNPTLEIWRSSDGTSWTKLASATPPGRDGFALAVYRDKLWLAGGEHSGTPIYPDVWNTEDGTSWTLVADGSAVAWEPRSDHALITFQDKLWIAGGHSDGTWALNNCYSSEDGRSWVLKSQLDRNGRAGLSMNVFNNKLYAFGGEDHGPYGDEYDWTAGVTTSSFMSSIDGSNWTDIVSFGDIQDHASVVLNGRIFIFGGGYWGDDEIELNSSVWATPVPGYDAAAPVSYISQTLPRRSGQTVSIDLINTGSLAWTSSAGFVLKVVSDPKRVAANTMIPLAAGSSIKPGEKVRFTLPLDLSQLWGAAEVKVQMFQPEIQGFGDIVIVSISCVLDDTIGWHAIETHPEMVFYDCYDELVASGTDLWLRNWRSRNGLDWLRTSCLDIEPWEMDYDDEPDGGAQDMVYFNGKLICPGQDYVWSSKDGMSWSRSEAKWTDYVSGHFDGDPQVSSCCVLGDKLYVIIYYDLEYEDVDCENRNVVWSTSDGTNWSKLSTFADLAESQNDLAEYGQMVAFKGKLWMFGGVEISVEAEYGETYIEHRDSDNIYSSSDGKTWKLVGHLPRPTCLTGVAVYRDKIWAADETGGLFSSDGINWEPATPVPSYGSFQVFDDRLWAVSEDEGLWCGSADDHSAMLSCSALDFGRRDVMDAPGSKQTVDVYNVGVSILGFTGTGAEIVSSRPGEFTFASAPNISPVSIGGTRSLNILFKPSRIGPTSATLRVTTNDPKHPVLTVKLTGEGIAAQPLKAGNIIAYLLGKSSDAAGLDKNADSKINIADLVYIQNSPIKVTSPSQTMKADIGAAFPIRWKAPTQISRVNVALARNHEPVMTIKSNTANDGSTTWTVPSTLIPDSNYSVTITDAAHPGVQGESQFFSVNSGDDFEVEYPIGGETLRRGSTIPVSWFTHSYTQNIRVELWKNDAPYKTLISSRPTASGDVYGWTIPSDFATGDNFRIVVIDADDASRRGYSSNVFSITK